MTQEHDAETVERVAKAIWDEIRDLEDRCDMEWDDMPRDHTHFVSARAALSAMPAREVKVQAREDAVKDYDGIISPLLPEPCAYKRSCFRDGWDAALRDLAGDKP